MSKMDKARLVLWIVSSILASSSVALFAIGEALTNTGIEWGMGFSLGATAISAVATATVEVINKIDKDKIKEITNP